MSIEERVLRVLYDSFDEINESLPVQRRIAKKPDAVIYDAQQVIDSLGLTLLIVAVEQRIEQEFGKHISLFDQNAVLDDQSPFKNTTLLVNHITKLLG